MGSAVPTLRWAIFPLRRRPRRELRGRFLVQCRPRLPFRRVPESQGFHLAESVQVPEYYLFWRFNVMSNKNILTILAISSALEPLACTGPYILGAVVVVKNDSFRVKAYEE